MIEKSRDLILGMMGVGLLCLAMVPSCKPKEQPSYAPSSGAESGVHAVHSEKLQKLMLDLKRNGKRLPQELDLEGQRQRRLDQVAQTSSEMAKSAEAIGEVLEGVDLTDSQRTTFLELAQKLESQSEELAQAARGGDLSEVSRMMEQIDETCDFCHRRFRVLPLVSEGAN